MSGPLLRIEGLVKRYGPQGPCALDGVDLEVDSGESIAVLGLSGAGKSTLIRCVNRLVEPTAGRIYWRGEDVLAYGRQALRAHRRRIGMIFQGFHLIERLNVLDNVLVGAFGRCSFWAAAAGRHPPERIAAAERMLERVGLAAFARRRVRELSGGQRQRVAIARALMQEPETILGDEPVSNLDPATSASVLALLRRINREDGITLILNLHSVELAKAHADRIIGLAGGRIVFDGPPQALSPDILHKIYPV